MFPFPTPCKGKSKSQPFAHTFALTGRRRLCIDTQGVALGSGLVGLSARAGPQTRLFPHNLHQLNISILNTLAARGSVRRNPRRERPERAASSEPRATPWVPCSHSLRPVRAKVKASRSPILLPLQGVGVYALIPRALPWAVDLLGFQPAQGRRRGFFRIIFINLIFQY